MVETHRPTGAQAAPSDRGPTLPDEPCDSGLPRQDEEQRVKDAILAGYRDLAAGRTFPSTGDFHRDMAIFAEKERTGWR
jgi:hypothetical protein